MIRKPKFKIGRRLGAGVYEKCQTNKFTISEGRKEKNKQKKRPKALSDYGLQLIEKQKIRLSYGLSERQFQKYITMAMSTYTKGVTRASRLLEELETRLDNVIYRLGLAKTRAEARQMVSHGHFLVNSLRTKVPSHRLRIGDVISIRTGSLGKSHFQNVEKKMKNVIVPEWISFDLSGLTAKILGKPKEIDPFFDFNTVLEFYSR